MPDINYQELARALLQEQGGMYTKFKAAGSTPNAVMGHGAGGLFSSPALDRQVFSAMVLPTLGVASLLPVRPSNFTHPLYGIMTGVTATSGSEPSGVCDDPPYAGLMKLCSQTAPFGRQSRRTRVYELDQFGRLTSRGEHTDFLMQGNPFKNANPNVPTIPGGVSVQDAANQELGKAMFEFAVAWARDFAVETYTGNPTNNTAGGGRKYFRGFDLLINTGYRDAETGVACPAADSIIDTFGNNTVVAANATFYVSKITNVFRALRKNAQDMGLAPATWKIAMRYGLFYALTDIWPCQYYTYQCATSTPAPTVMANDQVALRDDMRMNQYLLIDGEKIEVVIDDAIVEDGIGAGVQQSAMYIIPFTVLGGVVVTYIEYFNYDSPGGLMDAANALAPGDSYFVSDGGRFAWHKKPPTNWCVELLAKTEPRIVERTPFLAARITNARYSVLPHERDWLTTGSYFVDGGGTMGQAPSYYPPTT